MIDNIIRWTAINLGPEPPPIDPQETIDHEKRVAIWRAKVQARETLRGGGYLLHVHPDGTEQRLTMKDVASGLLFLSVFIRDGFEFTRTYNPARNFMAHPRGAGWVIHVHCPMGHWTEWRRKAVQP